MDPGVPVPERFGIVTACNPNGITVTVAENEAATERLRTQLAAEGWEFFLITGCSPDLSHQEPGFGVVCENRETIVELGRTWRQEAVFWIEDRTVHLVPCGRGESVAIGQWQAAVRFAK